MVIILLSITLDNTLQVVIFHVEQQPFYSWYEQCFTINSFPSENYEMAYNLLGISLMCGLPVTTFLYCHTRIFIKLRQML